MVFQGCGSSTATYKEEAKPTTNDTDDKGTHNNTVETKLTETNNQTTATTTTTQQQTTDQQSPTDAQSEEYAETRADMNDRDVAALVVLGTASVALVEDVSADVDALVPDCIVDGAVAVGTAVIQHGASLIESTKAAGVVQAMTRVVETNSTISNVVDASLDRLADLKQIATGGYIFLSESARFFTIGKIAIGILEQMYSMWNAWSQKSVWVGEFMSFLKLVEYDLVEGMKTFEHVGFLRSLEKELETTKGVLEVIQQRSTMMSLLLATTDRATLEMKKVKIEERKKECLFGHAVEINKDTKESLVLLDELAILIRDRNLAIEDGKKLHPDLEQHRMKLEKELTNEPSSNDDDDDNGVVHNNTDSHEGGLRIIRTNLHVQRCWQDIWIYHRRKKFLNKSNEVERHAYVQTHLPSCLKMKVCSKEELMERILRNDIVSRGSSSTLNASELRTSIDAKELAAHRQLSTSDRIRCRNILEDELKELFHSIDQTIRIVHNHHADTNDVFIEEERSAYASRLSDAWLKMEFAGRIIHSLENLSKVSTNETLETTTTTPTTSTSTVSHIDRLFQIAQTIESRQKEIGEWLSMEDDTVALNDLLTLRMITPSERTLYLDDFKQYYSNELCEIERLLDLGTNVSGSQMPLGPGGKRTTKGRVLAIKPPPPSSSSSVDSTAPNPTTSIFLAYLIDLYPSSFRAIHFTPSWKECQIALKKRIERKKRENERKAVPATTIATTLAAVAIAPSESSPALSEIALRNRARAERRAADPDDYVSDDEVEPTPTVAHEPDAPTPTAAAESTVADAGLAGTGADLDSDDSSLLNDAVVRSDLHHIFPSLAWQLYQYPSLLQYRTNLLEHVHQLTRQQLYEMSSTDFMFELFSSKLVQTSSEQVCPNPEPNSEEEKEGIRRKVCCVIDAPYLASDQPGGDDDGARDASMIGDFETTFLTSMDKQVKQLPEWSCFVLTIPHKSRFEKRVAGVIPLEITKEAITEEEGRTDVR